LKIERAEISFQSSISVIKIITEIIRSLKNNYGRVFEIIHAILMLP
jgi:hypothetical protein